MKHGYSEFFFLSHPPPIDGELFFSSYSGEDHPLTERYSTSGYHDWFYYHDRDQSTMNCDRTLGTQFSIPFSTIPNEYTVRGGAGPVEETNTW